MGLDGVEIVMDVEDHFGITIKDEEAERVRTVNDLVALVGSRIRNAHSAVCPTVSSFLRIRACTRELTANPELKIRTKTLIIDVLTPPQRQKLWHQLDKILGSPTPRLRRPPHIRRILACVVVSAFVLATATALFNDLTMLPMNLALASIITLTLHLLTVSLRTHPPDKFSTFGCISKKMAGLTVASKRLELRTDDAIFVELRPIISGTLGIPECKIQSESKFVEDLGVG